jgi:hypothetical protein
MIAIDQHAAVFGHPNCPGYRRSDYGAEPTCKYCAAPEATHWTHGKTCEKKPHDNPNGGYLHGEDDDTPYDVDGWPYCGRCHQVLDV